VSLRSSISLRIFTLAVLLSVAGYMAAQVSRTAPDLVPTGKGWGEAVDHSNHSTGQAKPTRPNQCSNGICYHGGPVMLGSPNIYVIWYGNWVSGPGASDSSQGQGVVNNFLGSLSGSNYESINSTYYNGSGQHVSGLFNKAAQVNDNYSQGTSFGDAGVQAIVSRAISNGSVPSDTNGLYFVLTSSDVRETSGFCTQYCGWHTHATLSGSDIKYAFVGNPDQCPSACTDGQAPNGLLGADGMTSIVAHEQEEAISDPDLNAWYDRQGSENADKCAWTFGTVSGPSGAEYNLTLNGKNYLIQRNWVNASGGYCSMTNP
jgi:hypothetical protein